MNESLFLFLNNLSGKSIFFDTVVVFCAQYLWSILVAGAVIFLFAKRENFFEKPFVILGSAIIAWTISQIINLLFPIARPFLVLDITPLFMHGEYDSFPSGHATFAFALAVGLFFYNKPLAWLFAFGAFLMGVSRVIAGIHWPLDIIIGSVLGGIISFVVYHSVQIYKKKGPIDR